MTISKPGLLTHIQVWFPKYSTVHGDQGEWVALLADYKLQNASPVIIVEFTKAKHLMGGRFCIKRDDALRCQLDTNGKISCRVVPMSSFMHWETAQETHDMAMNVFDH